MRLLRPAIPVEVKCRAALRQIGELFPDRVVEERRRSRGGLGTLLRESLDLLAFALGCEAKALRLDHDPALGARRKVFRGGEHVSYDPPANDPAHLFYREKRAHEIKTNVRGDGAQHPDRVLIKRNRRIEARGRPTSVLGLKPRRRKKAKRKHRWPTRALRGRGFAGATR